MTARSSLIVVTTFAVLLQLVVGAAPKLLLWNASASVPRGLYLLRGAQPLRVGELVAVAPPTFLSEFTALRGYLPRNVLLVKHIAALGGQTVCRFARTITIDGRLVAIARLRDSRGRPLPTWQCCRQLRAGDVFLLNTSAADSFDGRYFGPLSASNITARAEPLWTVQERFP